MAPLPMWWREARGAINATAAALPLALSFGLVAYGVAGAAARPAGLTATVVAIVLGALVYVPLSRTALPTGSPSSSAALLLGACVAQLVQDPALHPGTPAGLALLLVATALAVLGGGVAMLLLGLLRAGALVRFVPQPVLAGFMNGVAVLMVVAQLPVLLGIDAETLARQGWQALPQWRWPTLLAALLTTGLGLAVRRRWPRAPAALIALVLGSAAVHAVEAACAAQGTAQAAACTLPTFGALSMTWPKLSALVPLADPAVFSALAPHASVLAATALLLALIGALESALNIAAIDQQMNRRTDLDRELVAIGIANMVSGLLAGLPLIYLRLRAMATLAAGGRSWRSALLSCVMLALVFAVALPLVSHVPLAVVGGIVVMLAWGLVDLWTRQLLALWWRGERTTQAGLSLVVVGVVCAVTLAAGFVAAVGVGVLLSMLIFVRALNRSLVRLRYSAAQIPSRRVYAPAVEAQLAPLRAGIVVIELEGALFFGNIDRLATEAQEATVAVRGAHTATTTPPPSYLVLDLRRVSTVDASGAVGLMQLRTRLADAGSTLLLAGVTPDNRHGRAMQAQGALRDPDGKAAPWPLHADADHAIEAAETALLQAVQSDVVLVQQVPLAHNALLEGLTAAELAQVVPQLVERRLAAGERLFAEGDPGHSIYLLTEGSVSMLDRAGGQRFVSFSPGMCFGETAVLDGRGRTADARADVASVVYELPSSVFETLRQEQPAVAAGIYRNLALHLSARLRSAAAAWRLAAG
jgi:MFS superfamily sulfate permease-like transporter